ncbi:hypothetical protein CVS40_12959 [Lucilia cuprina]|nr:hypothetical protein CVS40_12959 [Lucilia cuprina]
MEGFKLIKTKFGDNKQIIGVQFCGKNDYNLFIIEAKKVYKIQEDLNVNIFSNDFIINEEIFTSYVAQCISNNDFVLDIKLDDTNFFNSTSQFLPVIDQPVYERVEISGDADVIHFSQESLPAQSGSLIPSTDEIQRILNIQSLLNINQLENKHRTLIAKSIIFHILNNNPNKKLQREDFLELSQSIVEIFPSEVKGTYYVPFAKGHLAKGKLYDAYNNARAKLSAAGVIKRRVKSKPENINVEELNILEDDVENLLEILKSGCAEWDLVRENWKKTHLFRQTELKNGELKTIDYMEKYKFQIDFDILYPGSKNIHEWKLYYQKVIVLSKKQKDNAVKEILTYIDSTEEEDSKLALTFMLLPYILPTSRKKKHFNS